MLSEECPLCYIIANPTEDMKIKELELSTAFLYGNQTYRGYCIVVYNSHETALENLSKKNQMQFYLDMLKVSSAIIKAFKPDKMNYELLGNKVPHLHWHVVPRYKTDPCWGRPIWIKSDVVTMLNDEESDEIIEAIRKYL